MSFEKVTIEDVEQVGPDDADIPPGAKADSVGGLRVLTDALGTEGLSINHYELAPGESFTVSVHRHGIQEELFYVVSGEVTFEVASETVSVAAGELIRIPPGTFQLGTNRGEKPTTAIALGAPREYETNTEWLMKCAACEEETVHVVRPDEVHGALIYQCTDCDADTFHVSADS